MYGTVHNSHTCMHFRTFCWGLSLYESQGDHKEGTSIYSEVEYPQRPPTLGVLFYFVTGIVPKKSLNLNTSLNHLLVNWLSQQHQNH